MARTMKYYLRKANRAYTQAAKYRTIAKKANKKASAARKVARKSEDEYHRLRMKRR